MREKGGKSEISLRDAPDKPERAVSETGEENDLGHESAAGEKAQETSVGASFLGISTGDGVASISGASAGLVYSDVRTVFNLNLYKIVAGIVYL
jgi:hypothetical protein